MVGNSRRRASKRNAERRRDMSRLSDEWSDDDFDVLADGVVVGRIMKAMAHPECTPWMWTLTFGQYEEAPAAPRLRDDARGRTSPA